ncbi:MAG: YicC/YloC family endoribonuclease [Fidelibacterota bacterium]
MIRSMTGSGYATVEADGRSISVGIRAVNSRYCNIAVKVTDGLETVEDTIRRAVQERCKRGRITVDVVVEETVPRPDGSVTFDRKRFEAYASVLEAIERDYGKRIDIAQVVDMKDLVMVGEERVEVDEKRVMEGVREALEMLDGMRIQEGETIARDILARVESIKKGIQGITELSGGYLAQVRERYRDRIRDLMDGEPIDENRILQEAAVLAEKMDVTEECVRCVSHLDQFKELLESVEPVGKRLNFLLQEIGREVNTIGSKSDNLEIIRMVVDLKDEVERVKEQIQNVL